MAMPNYKNIMLSLKHLGLKELEQIRLAAGHNIVLIETEKKEETLKKYIGKYFRYRNSYSCPKDPTDYWYIYFYAVKIEDGEIIGISFQKTIDDKIIIELKDTKFSLVDWEKITKRTFDREFNKIMTTIERGFRI